MEVVHLAIFEEECECLENTEQTVWMDVTIQIHGDMDQSGQMNDESTNLSKPPLRSA